MIRSSTMGMMMPKGGGELPYDAPIISTDLVSHGFYLVMSINTSSLNENISQFFVEISINGNAFYYSQGYTTGPDFGGHGFLDIVIFPPVSSGDSVQARLSYGDSGTYTSVNNPGSPFTLSSIVQA